MFGVNDLSNTVSTFTIGTDSVALASLVDSGGVQPISVTGNDGIVYVLDTAGGRA